MWSTRSPSAGDHTAAPQALPSLRQACSLLPSGLRPCRSGGASSAALRPACACDRAGRPARSGEIGLRPLGGFGHPPPRLVEALLVTLGLARSLDLQQDLRHVGGGGVNPR